MQFSVLFLSNRNTDATDQQISFQSFPLILPLEVVCQDVRIATAQRTTPLAAVSSELCAHLWCHSLLVYSQLVVRNWSI